MKNKKKSRQTDIDLFYSTMEKLGFVGITNDIKEIIEAAWVEKDGTTNLPNAIQRGSNNQTIQTQVMERHLSDGSSKAQKGQMTK